MKRARLILLIGLLFAGTAQAAEPLFYYERHSEGWFWYHEPIPPTKKAPRRAARPPAAHMPAPGTPADPVAIMAAFRKALERAKDLAILKPTDAHVKAYLRLNQIAMTRAVDFSQAWQRVVWTSPQYDTRLAHPVNDQAVQVYNDASLRISDAFLRQAAHTYGIFFFFRGSCPFCHRFAPVLAAFARTYGFQVIPVSLDGGGLPQFPHPRLDAGAGLSLHVKAVPAVFLVNPRKLSIHPVAFGYVSGSELRRRIYTLLNGGPPNPAAPVAFSGGRTDEDQ